VADPVVQVNIKGVDEQIRRFADVDAAAAAQLRQAMDASLEEVQSEIEPRIPVGATGGIKKSFGSRIDGTGSRIVGHYGSKMKHVVPQVLEYGRAPSKTPRSSKLEAWVQKVLGISGPKVKSVAYLIARSIGKKGTKGKFFMKTGKRITRPKVFAYFEKAVKKIVEALENGR
jgi:hypothetical protein